MTTEQNAELETLLSLLMGPSTIEGGSWSWCHWDGERHHFALEDDTGGMFDVNTPTEAISAINARLAELAPKGWRVTLAKWSRTWHIEADKPSNKLAGRMSGAIRYNLADCIAKALEHANADPSLPANGAPATPGRLQFARHPPMGSGPTASGAAVNKLRVALWHRIQELDGSASSKTVEHALNELIAAVRAENIRVVDGLCGVIAEVREELAETKDMLADMECERGAANGERDEALKEVLALRWQMEDLERVKKSLAKAKAELRARPVDAPARKAVALATLGTAGDSTGWSCLYALCDDGTIWYRDAFNPQHGWKRELDIPQPEQAIPKTETTEEAR